MVTERQQFVLPNGALGATRPEDAYVTLNPNYKEQ